MMKIGLIATIGTRDIQIRRQELEKKIGTDQIMPLYHEVNGRSIFLARPGGDFLLDKFKMFSGKLEFPILKPAIDWVYQKHEQIDKIILVGTDQQGDHTADLYKNRDTVYFAEILKRLIPSSYKDKQSQFDIQLSLLKKDVVYLDAMYSQVSKLIHEMPFKKLWALDRIYLLNQGGIDAINSSLLLNGLNVFGKKLHLLSVNESTRSCTPLRFPEQYFKENTKSKLESYLKSFNYPAIKYLEVHQDIKALAGYGEHRLNFDFDQAIFSISHLIDHSWKEQLVGEIRKMQENEFELLREVYLNARIKFDQEAYVDFLFRIFRIVEGLAKYNSCKHIGLDFDRYTWKDNILAILNEEANKGLKKFLENYKIGKYPLDLERTPTIPVWIAILEYYDAKLADFLKKVRHLAELRNQSIGAHNFNPVSLQLIEEELAKNDIDTDFLFKSLDKLFESKQSFAQLNTWMLQVMKEK